MSRYAELTCHMHIVWTCVTEQAHFSDDGISAYIEYSHMHSIGIEYDREGEA